MQTSLVQLERLARSMGVEVLDHESHGPRWKAVLIVRVVLAMWAENLFLRIGGRLRHDEGVGQANNGNDIPPR